MIIVFLEEIKLIGLRSSRAQRSEDTVKFEKINLHLSKELCLSWLKR